MNCKICSFFGHRELYENIDEILISHIKFSIEEMGVTEFYIGGYGQFDQRAKELVYGLKNEYHSIKLYLALAYMPTKDTFIDDKYDGSVFLDGLESAYKRFAITKRNKLMVEESDVVICYVKRLHGGAYTASKYAYNKNKIVLNCSDSDMFNWKMLEL